MGTVNYVFYLEKRHFSLSYTACDLHARRKQETIPRLVPELIPLLGHPGVTGDFFGIHTQTAQRDYSVLKAPALAAIWDS